MRLVQTEGITALSHLPGPALPVRGGTRATEPTTSDLGPFPAVSLGGLKDLDPFTDGQQGSELIAGRRGDQTLAAVSARPARSAAGTAPRKGAAFIK